MTSSGIERISLIITNIVLSKYLKKKDNITDRSNDVANKLHSTNVDFHKNLKLVITIFVARGRQKNSGIKGLSNGWKYQNK